MFRLRGLWICRSPEAKSSSCDKALFGFGYYWKFRSSHGYAASAAVVLKNQGQSLPLESSGGYEYLVDEGSWRKMC